MPPQTEISSPPVTVPEPEPVNTVTTPQQLDLREIENAKRIQQRLIDLGFLFGAADGVWGQRSRQALQEFRAANGIGESDTWDEATQERLLGAPDARAANTSDISFIGGWGIDVAECRESPITITARRAEAFGTACEFHSTQRESSNVWRLRAECASKTERWNANIRFTVSTSKLTWSSERGTTTYVRCPMASASRESFSRPPPRQVPRPSVDPKDTRGSKTTLAMTFGPSPSKCSANAPARTPC